MGWGGRHTTSLLRCTDLPHPRAVLKLLWKNCKNYPSKCKNWGEGGTFIKPILSCTFMYLKQKSRVCATDSVGKGTFITKRSNCPSSLLISYPQNVFRVILKKVLSTRGKVPKYRKEKYSRKCLLCSPSNKGETVFDCLIPDESLKWFEVEINIVRLSDIQTIVAERQREKDPLLNVLQKIIAPIWALKKKSLVKD